jgi:hypothetical protein
MGALMTARERFVQTRQYVIELNNIKALIMSDGDDWKPPGVKVHAVSDPTASRAIRNVDEWGEQLAELRKREAELEYFIGTTREIIEAVRSGLGSDYADILDKRYIDCLTWQQMDMPKSTGKLKVAIAFDWVDSIGISRLLRGEVEV